MLSVDVSATSPTQAHGTSTKIQHAGEHQAHLSFCWGHEWPWFRIPAAQAAPATRLLVSIPSQGSANSRREDKVDGETNGASGKSEGSCEQKRAALGPGHSQAWSAPCAARLLLSPFLCGLDFTTRRPQPKITASQIPRSAIRIRHSRIRQSVNPSIRWKPV
jgi:hypothetical protein